MVMLLQTMFIIGLRIVGQQLSDPYGNDIIDLQIMRYVKIILLGSNAILNAENLTPPSLIEETALMYKSDATKKDILESLVDIIKNEETMNDKMEPMNDNTEITTLLSNKEDQFSLC
mmetsp:Transcript_30108/g.34305  ORF Transcript_30108/g.34305 Transcript_30108/m.34305 type:complete len:117 (-) Transcript_30108:223-573(-)